MEQWYKITIDGTTYLPISILRNKKGLPLQFTFKDGRKTSIKDIPENIGNSFCMYENNYIIESWYPKVSLIENSRISARPNMTIEELFTKRTLACRKRPVKCV